MATTLRNYIGGEWLSPQAAEYLDLTNPATGEPLGKVPLSGAQDVDAAVAAAQTAFLKWRQVPPVVRARYLFKLKYLMEEHFDELATTVTREHGKTLDEARGSVRRGIENVEHACGVPALMMGKTLEDVASGIDCEYVRQPLGVFAAVTPFNFPAMVPCWFWPYAIATGNTFILKPSEQVPFSSTRILELAQQAGVPAGVLNMVHGAKEVVNALLAHPGITGISFVGSSPVAKYVYQEGAKHGKRVQALGGAKNHAVVLPDADLEFAADALIGAAYGSAGERCMAISAVVAVGSAGDKLVSLLKQKAQAIKIGPGDQDGVEMGPLVTAQHRDKVASYVEKGKAEGAKAVLDGGKPPVKEGYFLGTSLFDHVKPDMQIYKDEIFGPVLVVVRVSTLEEAIALVNKNPYANGTAIFTESGGAARRFQNEVQVGMVGINVPIPVPVAFYSFGGWKNSLFGDLHVHGTEGVKFYTRTKVITTRWPHQDTPAPGLNMPTLG